MANVRGTRRVIGDGSSASRQRNAVFEDFVPSYDWTEDPDGHYLLVDLPDFKKEQVKVQVINSTGQVKIYGERPVNENKFIRFKQEFTVPDNSDIDAITAKFDGEILYVTVPKHKVEQKREPEPEPEPARENNQSDQNQKPNSNEEQKKDDGVNGKDQVCQSKEKEKSHRNAPMSFSEKDIRKWEREHKTGYLRSAVEMLSKNKAVVVTAMIAFSLGMLISRKFESDGE